jgi:hypothetical protein
MIGELARVRRVDLIVCGKLRCGRRGGTEVRSARFVFNLEVDAALADHQTY